MPSHRLPPSYESSSSLSPSGSPQAGQIKLCYSCYCPLTGDSPTFLAEADGVAETAIVCGSCHDRTLNHTARPTSQHWETHQPSDEEEGLSHLRTAAHGHRAQRRSLGITPSQTEPLDGIILQQRQPHCSAEIPLLFERPPPLQTQLADTTYRPYSPPTPSSISSISRLGRSRSPISPIHPSYQQSLAPFFNTRLDPYQDITRLRVSSNGLGCLYAGAKFTGTQKSDKSSYDVTVTIVDVDMSSSFLCGYLRIRGLTDDYPELTTYFDAEIIGSRHGFLTQDWGATEEQDLKHWDRFPAFKQVKSELRKPNLTMRDRKDRGIVFMRWKERFLVPDYRVKDINGASFAGFYYVCVDVFGDLSRQHDLRSDSEFESRATMNGFYFHLNSEPYQQLTLHHVPDLSTQSFEFR